MKRIAVVFVHGLFSSPQAWDAFAKLLSTDPDVVGGFDLHYYRYSSPVFEWKPNRAIPTLDTISKGFATFLATTCREHDRLVLVAHSQGGLIVQRYLSDVLADGRGQELRRVCSVVLFACPNSGSEFMLSVRSFFRQPQDLTLRPFVESIADTQRRVLDKVIYAREVTGTSCPIPITAYAGESDNIVRPASAMAVFPSHGVLPGDHSSIIRPTKRTDLTYVALKYHLLEARQSDAPREPRAASVTPPSTGNVDGGPRDAHSFGIDAGVVVPGPDPRGIALIAEGLQSIPELADSGSRHQFVLFLAPDIRGNLGGALNLRLELIALIRTCARFGDAGRDSLTEALQLAFASGDPVVKRVLSLIEEHWPVGRDSGAVRP
ncbi:alpha/beta fold hydrolase [Micromonospora sp. NPDC048909]|uniref:alpha/beta fold hydrolase n=1 Tax=Micromonospora sp. NPDC048909 TaxID=3155643 RepID=UPI00340E6464